jgi:hypothetical protein
MANDVFANGREISCKKADGKSICAFPDVCMTPPENPATPPGVPVPYPNTGFAKDTTSGSKNVKISGQEVILKNKSYFKKSTGDEAGCAAKKGVVTSVNRGKVYFNAWSMDVKFEGENVVRHLDLTTHNHGSKPPNSLPTVYQDMLASLPKECSTMRKNFEKECASARVDKKKKQVTGCTKECEKAQKCIRIPKDKDKVYCCGTSTENHERTGDHLIEVSCFTEARKGLNIGSYAELAAKGIFVKGGKFIGPKPKNYHEITLEEAKSKPRRLSGFDKYNDEKAPTVCAPEPNANGKNNKHNAMQAARDQMKRGCRFRQNQIPLSGGKESFWTYDEAAAAGARSHKIVHDYCDEACTRAQIDQYHQHDPNGPQVSNEEPVRTYIHDDDNANIEGGENWLTDRNLLGRARNAYNLAMRGLLGRFRR